MGLMGLMRPIGPIDFIGPISHPAAFPLTPNRGEGTGSMVGVGLVAQHPSPLRNQPGSLLPSGPCASHVEASTRLVECLKIAKPQ